MIHKLSFNFNQPLNIMFGKDGGVKVGDFGLVSKEERDDDGCLLERTQKVGTRSYMSPEQVCHLFAKFTKRIGDCTVHRVFYLHVSQRLHQKKYGRKVDIYAAGLIFFELLWRFGTASEKQKVSEIIHVLKIFKMSSTITK